ncbi:MAG: UDP-N-acetylmuramoyl-L-alanine--D-glutamate ligase [Candidatus Paceibacterota bacterium]|jgi:UDP-N-acetylmuramoylalanine--D-glutamate ligase
MDYKNYFKNKKITVMGLGLLGRGVGDAIFLAGCGAKLTVTDFKTKEQLATSIKKLSKCKNIKFSLGGHKLRDFNGKDFVLKAAGVPIDSPYIKEARKNKIPVEMSSSLFVKLAGIPIIGVTGTRGKSTVAYLIHHILKSAGKKVFLGGNVLGVSTLSFLPKAKQYDYAVLELDSWQLQGFGESKLSPDISVFTTFLDDHLNYYASTSLSTSRKKYFTDKAGIFKYQKGDDLLIAGKQAYPFIKKWGSKVRGELVVPEESLPRGWKISLPGKHNEYNARLAVEVARSLWIPDAVIKKSLATFSSVPGRLELIRMVKGVRIYNDTNSTTPDATIVALRALGGSTAKLKKIVLIAGGADKGLEMSALVKEIPKYCKEVVLLKGSGTEKIKNKIKGKEFDNFKKAVQYAFGKAKRGDVLLLSPAFASFGMFKNEYDRGEQFVRLVKKLK